jgi:Fe-S-cluster-containing dehydrogenase component
MKTEDRRDFIKKGVTAGTVAATDLGAWIAANADIEETGEMVKLLSQEGEIVEVDKAYLKMASVENADQLHKHTMGRDIEGVPGRKFVMVIDLGRCRNARKCIDVCQKMHHMPSHQELLKIKLIKDNELGSPYWLPKLCFHCDNPPCVKVCPVSATYKRKDGLVLIDNERCIGCKFCMVACPYSTRIFNWEEPLNPEDMSMDMGMQPETSLPHQPNTVEKCDFCPDMVRENKMPPCVTACPNGVFYFGDEVEDAVSNGDETVRLSTLLKDRAGYRYMEELGTQPRVYYLPPVNRMFPMDRGLKDLSDEQMDLYKDILE